MTLPGCAGVRNKLKLISPRPAWLSVAPVGCLMIGTMARVMSVALPSDAGYTGCMFNVFRVRSNVPMPVSTLYWKGTLIRLATGFWICLSRSPSWAVSGLASSAANRTRKPVRPPSKRPMCSSLDRILAPICQPPGVYQIGLV